jgi:hypothetical protein
MRIQRAKAIRQHFGQHWEHAIREVHRRRTRPRLLVEVGARLDLVTHIGYRDDQPPAVSLALRKNSIVEIPSVRAIYKYVKEKVGMYATLLSMQQDNILKGLEALTRKAQEIVLGTPSAATKQLDQQSSNDDSPSTASDQHLMSEPTIIPPAAASQATTPMLFS